MGLTWECLDLDNGTLTIKQQLRREQHKDGQFYFSKPKNNKTRTLTLAPAVVKLFRLQKLEQNRKRLKAGKSWTEKDLVFSNEVEGIPLSPYNLSLLQRACERNRNAVYSVS